ncbi:hypothetical protein CHS0354_015988 [Potamilus streckersoni]|uniref:Uncharacterized protein n=1 Tax=Potamilus streckersoni TaxID=2493646 RepID=A0AAE0SYE7_9BIVA|nr:hypothetical protein CHS0354_015988 [Potamilus streckersoni]
MDNTFNKTDVSSPADDTCGKEPENHETDRIKSSPRFEFNTILGLDIGSQQKEPLDDHDNSELYGSSSSSYYSVLSETGSFTISSCLNQEDADIGLHNKPKLDGQEVSDIDGSSSSSYTSALSDIDSYMLSSCLNQDFELEDDVFDDLDFECMLLQNNQKTSELYGRSSSPYNSASSETGSIALLPCLNLDKIQESDGDGFKDGDLNCKFPLDAQQKEERTPVCDEITQITLGDQEISHDKKDAGSYSCSSFTACGRKEKPVEKQVSSILGAQEGEETHCYDDIPLSSLEYNSLNMEKNTPLCNSVGACGGPDGKGDNLDPSTARVQSKAKHVLPPEIDQGLGAPQYIDKAHQTRYQKTSGYY